MMKIICAESEDAVGRIAAGIIASVINDNRNAVIGLATGSTPLRTYAALRSMYERGEISFSGISSVNLDEYVGLPADHPQSYRRFMEDNLFSHIDIPHDSTYVPSGIGDPACECRRYDKLLDSLGRVDIQLLGIGHNGHIAFMEPSDHFPKDTTHVRLSSSTVSANSRFFPTPSDVPTSAISMGIGRILRSRRILLLATGAAKAEILERALFGRITPEVPASILQFYMGELTVLGDPDAMRVIKENHPDSIC